MQILFFILYFIFFSFIISIIPFFKNSKIGKRPLIILFSIKIFCGFAYAAFYSLPQNYKNADTWWFYNHSLPETQFLINRPLTFFKDLFIHRYAENGNIFSGQNTYWNDLKSNVIIKLTAVFNIFSHNSYYVNIIFFNFLFLFGLVALFRLFYNIFPGNKTCIISGIFLLPSALFWCSGIHKDGLILSAAGVIIYTFYHGFKTKFTFRKISIISFSVIVLFSLRNYFVVALLPAVLAWWLCEKYKGRNLRIFVIVYLSAIIVCTIIPLFIPAVNIFSYVANKQHEFLLLEGSSKVNLPSLKPGIASFISFIPYALDMAFLRPHFNEIKNISYLPAFIENTFFVCLLSVSAARFNRQIRLSPEILFIVFFSFSILLLSGYTIPFTGAILRYKSIILPLIVTPLLCFTNLFNDGKIADIRTNLRALFKKA